MTNPTPGVLVPLSRMAAMTTAVSRHIDAGTRDADGYYDYYYEYDLFEYSLGSRMLLARSYTDTPAEAHFLTIREGGAEARTLTRADTRSALFRQAARDLRARGKTELTWLAPVPLIVRLGIKKGRRAYRPVPPTR
jgi:hypothetical protein